MYGFLYKARVFVRIDWKDLPKKNTLAYYENQQFMDKRSFITLGPAFGLK
jgi:hypothetical protein